MRVASCQKSSHIGKGAKGRVMDSRGRGFMMADVLEDGGESTNATLISFEIGWRWFHFFYGHRCIPDQGEVELEESRDERAGY